MRLLASSRQWKNLSTLADTLSSLSCCEQLEKRRALHKKRSQLALRPLRPSLASASAASAGWMLLNYVAGVRLWAFPPASSSLNLSRSFDRLSAVVENAQHHLKKNGRCQVTVQVPRVHNSAAHTTRVWTAALRAVPELHTLERLTRRLCRLALFVKKGMENPRRRLSTDSDVLPNARRLVWADLRYSSVTKAS